MTPDSDTTHAAELSGRIYDRPIDWAPWAGFALAVVCFAAVLFLFVRGV